jgi:hypothetical protein
VVKPGKTDAELKEEEELQLVLALSKETHQPNRVSQERKTSITARNK